MRRNIRRCRNFLNKEVTQLIVQGLLTSHLDYCNILYMSTPQKDLKKLQLIQNMGCSVIKGLARFDHVNNEMSNLHWLKIPERIRYKCALLMFQPIYGMALEILKSCIIYPKRHGGSTDDFKVFTPRCNESTVRDSSFKYDGARLWNELPKSLREFPDVNTCKHM